MSQGHGAGSAESLPEEGKEALSVLRGLWSAQGQSSRDVDSAAPCGKDSGSSADSSAKSCKATDSMTFEGLIDEVEATTDTTEAVTNVQSAWRKKLEQDGKLHRDGTSLRDLVLGDGDAETS